MPVQTLILINHISQNSHLASRLYIFQLTLTTKTICYLKNKNLLNVSFLMAAKFNEYPDFFWLKSYKN